MLSDSLPVSLQFFSTITQLKSVLSVWHFTLSNEKLQLLAQNKSLRRDGVYICACFCVCEGKEEKENRKVLVSDSRIFIKLLTWKYL